MADRAAAVQTQTSAASDHPVSSRADNNPVSSRAHNSAYSRAHNQHTMTPSYQQLCMAQMLNGAVLTEAARRMQFYQYHLAQKSAHVHDAGTDAQLAYAHTQVASQLKYMIRLEEQAAAILTEKASVALDPPISVAANAMNEQTRRHNSPTTLFQQQHPPMPNQSMTAFNHLSPPAQHLYDAPTHDSLFQATQHKCDASMYHPQQLGRYPQPYHKACRHFTSTGFCRHGDSCTWFHPELPVLNEDNLPVRSPDVSYCADYWQTGVCDAGPTCSYNHAAGMRNSIRQPIRPKASLCPDGASCKEFGRCTYNHLEPARNAQGLLTDSNLNKCFDYISYRTCSRGVACPYDHSEPELNSLNLPIRPDRPVCITFEQTGNCEYAFEKTRSYCKYNHPEVFVRHCSDLETADFTCDAAIENTCHQGADFNFYTFLDDTINNACSNHVDDSSMNTTDPPEAHTPVLQQCGPRMPIVEPCTVHDVFVPSEDSVGGAHATQLRTAIPEQTTPPAAHAQSGIMCQKFAMYGVCPFGRNCSYDHEPLSGDEHKPDNVPDELTCSTGNEDLSDRTATPKAVNTKEENVVTGDKCTHENQNDDRGNSVTDEWISGNQPHDCAEQRSSALNIALGDKDYDESTMRVKKDNPICHNGESIIREKKDNAICQDGESIMREKKDNALCHDGESIMREKKDNALCHNGESIMREKKNNALCHDGESIMREKKDNALCHDGESIMREKKENAICHDGESIMREKKDYAICLDSESVMREKIDNAICHDGESIMREKKDNAACHDGESIMREKKDNARCHDGESIMREKKDNARCHDGESIMREKKDSALCHDGESIMREKKDNARCHDDESIMREKKDSALCHDGESIMREKKDNALCHDSEDKAITARDSNDSDDRFPCHNGVQEQDGTHIHLVEDWEKSRMLQDSKEIKALEHENKENNTMQDIKENKTLGNTEQIMENVMTQGTDDSMMLKSKHKKGRKTMWDINAQMMQLYKNKKENAELPESDGDIAQKNMENCLIQDITANIVQNRKGHKEKNVLQGSKNDAMLKNKDKKNPRRIEENANNRAEETWDEEQIVPSRSTENSSRKNEVMKNHIAVHGNANNVNEEQSFLPRSKECIMHKNEDSKNHNEVHGYEDNVKRESDRNNANEVMQDMEKTMACDDNDTKDKSVAQRSNDNGAEKHTNERQYTTRDIIPQERESTKGQRIAHNLNINISNTHKDHDLLQGSKENAARDNMNETHYKSVQDNTEARPHLMRSTMADNDNITHDDSYAADSGPKEHVVAEEKDSVLESASTKTSSDVCMGAGYSISHLTSLDTEERTRWRGTLTTWTGLWGFIECSDLRDIVFISENCSGIDTTKTHLSSGTELSFVVAQDGTRLIAQNVSIESMHPCAQSNDDDSKDSEGKTTNGRYIGTVVEWQRYWGLIQTCALPDFVYCHANASNRPLHKGDKVTFMLDNRIPEVLKAADVELVEVLPDSQSFVEARVDKEHQSVLKDDEELPTCTTALCRPQPINPSRTRKVDLSPSLESGSPVRRRRSEESNTSSCEILEQENTHRIVNAPRKKRRRCSSDTERTNPSRAVNTHGTFSPDVTADAPVRENTRVADTMPSKEKQFIATTPAKRELTHVACQVIVRMRRAMCTRNMRQLMEAVASAEAMKLECRELCVAKTIINQPRKRANRLSRERAAIDRHVGARRKGVKKT